MKIARLEIQGFKSFKDYQEFSFNINNGLYFVTGKNLEEINLGANGAGKSALFEAICWCLYGKTSTNLKAGNVVNWSDKGCAVALTFDNNDIIEREQNPNKLTINDSPITQEELEKHLSFLGFESFLYSTFISQFSSKFFDLSPADKMVVFSDIMAETLYPWELRSIKAKTKAEQTNIIIKNMEIDISRLQGSLNQLNNTDYSDQIKEFDRKKKEEIIKLKEYKKEINGQIIVIKESVKELMKEKIKLELKLKKIAVTDRSDERNKIKEKYNKIIDGIKLELEKIKNKQNEVTKYLFKNKAEYNILQKEKDKIQSVGGISTCPTCLQKVDKKLLKGKEEEIQRELIQLEKEYSHAKDTNNILNGDFAEMQKKSDDKRLEMDNKSDELQELIAKETKDRSELLTKMKVIQTTIDGHNNNLKSKTGQITRINNDMLSVEDRENDYLALEKKRKEDIIEVTKVINDNQTELELAKKEYDCFSYWIKGFREIRLLLMYDALKELEVSINNNLNKFGLSDWSISLDIDKSNKDGSIRKGFAVLINSPDHGDNTPLDCFSGGERQRLVLAGSIGLMDLIQSKRQIDMGIEIYDESSAWLSESGISDLVQILFDRAKENEKKIFLIDHKNLGSYGIFSGIISIVKDKTGSHIITAN